MESESPTPRFCSSNRDHSLHPSLRSRAKITRHPAARSLRRNRIRTVTSIRQIKPLRRRLKIMARPLPRNSSIKLTLSILLTPLIRLIQGHRYDLGLQQGHNSRPGKGRRTVEHSIVSSASQRMTIHGPDEDRSTVLRRLPLSVQ